MAEIVAYIAHSVDGFIADRTGSIDWLKPFETEDYGWDAFYGRIVELRVASIPGMEGDSGGAASRSRCFAFLPWCFAIIPASESTDCTPAAIAP